MPPGSGRLPCSGQGTAAPLCLALGHPLGVSAGSWDGFALRLCFGAAAVPRGAGSSVPLAHKTGWVAWHGVPLDGRDGPALLVPRAGQLRVCLSPSLPPSPCTWPIPGCEARPVPLRPPGQREGSLAQGQGSPQSTLGEFQAQRSGEGTGAGGGQSPAVPVRPHPRGTALGVMFPDALEGAEHLLGAVPALDGVQLCLRPPARLRPLGWARQGLGLCGETEPLGLGVNGGCGWGCLVPPSGWCWPRGDKGAGRKAAVRGAGTCVPSMAERPGRAVGSVEPVGTAGARGARLGVGTMLGRCASQGRNSVRPVRRVGTI